MNAVHIIDLHYAYRNQPVLEHITVSIDQGDFVALIGPNGSGKTTLARLIVGQLKPAGGTVRVFGKEPAEWIGTGTIGYVPQQFTVETAFPGTVQEILALKTDAQGIAKQLKIQNLLHQRFVELSRGQQQRVMIGLALQDHPKLLILDEPTAGVDIKAQDDFYKLLQQLNKQGITIVLITHDIGTVPKIATSVVCLNKTICCQGPSADAQKLVKRVYGVHMQEHHHQDQRNRS